MVTGKVDDFINLVKCYFAMNYVFVLKGLLLISCIDLTHSLLLMYIGEK